MKALRAFQLQTLVHKKISTLDTQLILYKCKSKFHNSLGFSITLIYMTLTGCAAFHQGSGIEALETYCQAEAGLRVVQADRWPQQTGPAHPGVCAQGNYRQSCTLFPQAGLYSYAFSEIASRTPSYEVHRQRVQFKALLDHSVVAEAVSFKTYGVGNNLMGDVIHSKQCPSKLLSRVAPSSPA